jgi:hypothetical protein
MTGRQTITKNGLASGLVDYYFGRESDAEATNKNRF